MIIGVTGPIGSGKGKVAEFFKKEGFVHHSFSREIRQIAKERGIEINRKSLTELGKKLAAEGAIKGKSILGERILTNIKNELDKGASRWVIEGIRRVQDADIFRDHEFDNKKMRFVLIGINADQKERWKRLQKRGRKGEPKSFEEFKKIDDAEWEGTLEVGKLMKRADYVIMNDGSLEELAQEVKKIRNEIL